MELLIVRHALPKSEQSEDGPADPPLSELGHQQALATAEFIAVEAIDAVVSSTMRRAVETAQPLAEHLNLIPETRAGLVESDYRRKSYTPAEEMEADDEVIQDFLADPMRMFSDGYEAFETRVIATFDAIIGDYRGQAIAVFCHGMVTSVLLKTILGHDSPFDLMPNYCGITRVSASSSGLRTVRSVNETAHLRNLT